MKLFEIAKRWYLIVIYRIEGFIGLKLLLTFIESYGEC